ncbi:MAG: hypothetical protein M3Q34_01300 [bacterium]|nr:hypothetical protein [bacterium]
MNKKIKKLISFLALVALVVPSIANVQVPGAMTITATSIGQTSAVLNAFNITSPAGPTGASELVYFQYTSTPSTGCFNMVNPNETGIYSAGPSNNWNVSVGISGLSQGTTYYYCIVIAPNMNIGNQFIYSNVATFTTKSLVQTGGQTTSAIIGDVETVDVVNVSDVEATFVGRLDSGSGTLFGYFRFSEIEIPPIFCNEVFGSDMRSAKAVSTLGSDKVIPGQSFIAKISDLEPDTQYAFCAAVSNHAKSRQVVTLDTGTQTFFTEPYIKYGSPIIFRTLPCQTCPHTKIKTNPAEVLTSTSAYLKGNYGSTKSTYTYFEYAEVPSDPNEPMGDWQTTLGEDHSPGYRNIRYKLTNLKPNTWYNFRAVAETGSPDELFDGLALSFRTPKFNNLGPNGTGPSGTGTTGGGTTGGGTTGGGTTGGGTTGGGTTGGGTTGGGTSGDGNEGDDGNNGDDGTGGTGTGGTGTGGTGTGGTGTGGTGTGEDCENPNDKDCGGIPDDEDSDIDNDGIPNIEDSDTDGDGTPNNFDADDDRDGIPDLIDSSPTGVGNLNDYDGSGIPNGLDSDMDGDGIPNECDADTDGDGTVNWLDPDDDNDGLEDGLDPTPTGRSSNSGICKLSGYGLLGVGDIGKPLSDDIVRYHEGIEHVFVRRILRSENIRGRYGYVPGTNALQFAYELAHTLAKRFGYVDVDGKEIRVSQPDVSAYSLRMSGNKLYVYEFYKNKVVDIRMIKNDRRVFKTPNPYEYFFKKKF